MTSPSLFDSLTISLAALPHPRVIALPFSGMAHSRVIDPSWDPEDGREAQVEIHTPTVHDCQAFDWIDAAMAGVARLLPHT